MVEKWLSDKQGQVFRYKLEKCAYALELLGNPERELPIIHVAGTNGKGSTVAFLRALFQEHGCRVGTFTSPHLVSVEDRVCINSQPISSEEFWVIAREIQELEAQVATVYEPFSYFETLTLLMVVYFSRQQLDVAVVEVGIGGLEDVTNLAPSQMSVITSIGMDHQEMLGDTLAEIAAQKAGIIKTQSLVLLGPLPKEAEEVCLRVAQDQASEVFLFGRDFSLMEGHFRNQERGLAGIELGLLGRHQEENAAVALQAFFAYRDARGQAVQEESVRRALAGVSWPGRMELVSQVPAIYLDGAHNVPAMERLIETVRHLSLPGVTILFAALARKDYQEMLALLQTHLPEARIVLSGFDGAGYDEVNHPSGFPFVADYRAFLQEWQVGATSDQTLLVTGSLYFISEVRAALLEEK